MNFELNSNQRHAFSTWQLAGPRRRTLSFVVDLALSVLLAWAITWAMKVPPPFTNLPSSLAIILAYWVHVGFSQAFLGYSIGQHLFGLKLFAPKLDDRPEPIQVASRMIALWAGVCFGFIGITPILWRRDRRGWQDSLSDSLVFGPYLEAPSEMQIKTGMGVFSVQVYTISGLALAALLTFSVIDRSRDRAAYLAESSALCQDVTFILAHAKDVVVATAISPSWSQCWSETKFNLGALLDSELARHIRFSHLHFEITTSENPTALKAEAHEMAKIENALCRDQQSSSACSSGRSPASNDRPTYLVFKDYLGSHFGLVDELFAKSKREDRIKFLQESLKQEAFSPLIKSAIEERIWAEELAMGEPSPRLNFDSYEGWSRVQNCWLHSLYPETTNSSCSIDQFSFFTHMLSRDPGETWDLDSIDYRLRDVRARNDLPKDFEKLLAMIRARSHKNPEEINTAWSEISRLSPLYSVAESWASKKTD